MKIADHTHGVTKPYIKLHTTLLDEGVIHVAEQALPRQVWNSLSIKAQSGAGIRKQTH